MNELEVPKLSWEERYKRMFDIAITLSTTYKTLLKEKYGEKETIALSKKVQGTMSNRTAKKLIQNYNLKPTVEDVIRLMKLYSCEVWGYGAEQYVGAYIESSGEKGVFVNKVCRFWEKRKEYGDPNRSTCHINCQEEYSHLGNTLAPDAKISMGQTYPTGGNCCEVIVEIKGQGKP